MSSKQDINIPTTKKNVILSFEIFDINVIEDRMGQIQG